MADDIVRVDPPEDEETVEQWSRESDDSDLLGVDAWLPEGDAWRVWVAMAEFVRGGPLESEMESGIEAALSAVSSVTRVWREDREQWVAEGTPSGRNLASAVATFVDSFAEKATLEVHGATEAGEIEECTGTLTRDEQGWQFTLRFEDSKEESFRWDSESPGDEPLDLEEVLRRVSNFVAVKTQAAKTATWSVEDPTWSAVFRGRRVAEWLRIENPP